MISDQENWLKIGCERGWCGPPVCEVHDGTPMSASEESSLFDGDDLCVHIVRLYSDAGEREQVEGNHSPSRWRASNRWQ